MKYPAAHRGLEYQYAAMMIAWGSWLVVFQDTFDNPIYRPLATIAPGLVWGAWSISIGALRIAALVVNGKYRRTPLIRVACSILGIIWWCVLIFLYLAGSIEHPAAGFAWFPVFVVFEAIACKRSAEDAFYSRALSRPPKRKVSHARPG